LWSANKISLMLWKQKALPLCVPIKRNKGSSKSHCFNEIEMRQKCTLHFFKRRYVDRTLRLVGIPVRSRVEIAQQVGIVTRQRAERLGFDFRQERGRECFFGHQVQTGPRAHQASYPISLGGIFPRGKAARE
jgi:hypothetical protein